MKNEAFGCLKILLIVHNSFIIIVHIDSTFFYHSHTAVFGSNPFYRQDAHTKKFYHQMRLFGPHYSEADGILEVCYCVYLSHCHKKSANFRAEVNRANSHTPTHSAALYAISSKSTGADHSFIDWKENSAVLTQFLYA